MTEASRCAICSARVDEPHLEKCALAGNVWFRDTIDLWGGLTSHTPKPMPHGIGYWLARRRAADVKLAERDRRSIAAALLLIFGYALLGGIVFVVAVDVAIRIAPLVLPWS